VDLLENLKREVATLREELAAAGIDLEARRKWKEGEERRKQRAAEKSVHIAERQAAREQTAEEQALRLWQAGSFVVDVGAPDMQWKRAKPGKELILRCPHCGTPIPSFPAIMAEFFEAYQARSQAGECDLIRHPIPMSGLWWRGVPAVREGTMRVCENCKNPAHYRLQMILPVPGAE